MKALIVKKLTNLLFSISLCFILSACASGTRPDMMTAIPEEGLAIPANSYKSNIILAGVSGGKETNPLLASKVSNVAFEQALTDSLINFGLYNGTNGRYQLEAELLALEQPMMGFSFTVNSVVEYKMYKDNASVFEKTIKASGTATTGDTIVGVERLKIANERAIKNNIRMFIDKVLIQ